jgi:hypothetical protein
MSALEARGPEDYEMSSSISRTSTWRTPQAFALVAAFAGSGQAGMGAHMLGCSYLYSIHGPVSAKPGSSWPTSLTQ